MAFDHHLATGLFVQTMKERGVRIVYLTDKKKWAEWDGTRYAEHTNRGQILKITGDFLSEFAGHFANADGKTPVVKKSDCEAVADMLTGHLFANSLDYDTDFRQLVVKGFVYDAGNQVVYPTDPDMKFLRSCTHFPAEGECPLWVKTISEITAAADGTPRPGYAAAFEQLVAAMALGGYHIHQRMIVAFGPRGRNGKNLIFDLLPYLIGHAHMGGYFGVLSPNYLVLGKDPKGEMLEAVTGARMTFSSEPEHGGLDTTRLKAMTGEDMISFRQMYVGPALMKRTFTPVMALNGGVTIKDADPATKRRLVFLPFERSFIGCEDPKLASKLLQFEGPQILYRLIGWWWDWHRRGCPEITCPEMEAMKAEWLGNQPSVENWATESLTQGDKVLAQKDCVTLKLAYEHYRQWQIGNGRGPVGIDQFKAMLGHAGVEVFRDYDNSPRLRYRALKDGNFVIPAAIR